LLIRTQLALYAARTGLVALDQVGVTDEQPELAGPQVASQPAG
jgi:hypothetical protein